MNNVKKPRSIFSISLFSFLIVVVPVYLAGFMIYRWAFAQIEGEILAAQSSQTEYYMEKLRSDVQRIIVQQSDLMNDKDVIMLSSLKKDSIDIDTVFAINRVMTRLDAIMYSSDIIKNVSIHLVNMERSIHAVGSISELSMEEYDALLSLFYQDSGQLFFKDTIPAAVVASSNQYEKDSKYPSYIVEVEFSPESISRTLRLMKDNPNGGIALFNKHGDILVGGTGNNDALFSFLEEYTGQSKNNALMTEMSTTVKTYDGSDYLVTIYRDGLNGIILVNYTSLEAVYSPLRQYQPYFVVFTLLVILMALLFLYIMYRQIKKPLAGLVRAFKAVEQGNFDINIECRNNYELMYLYSSFNSMVNRVKNLIDQVYKQKILYQKSELKQLQSQINPHFLYNSYFVLYDMAVSEDYENLAEFAKHMGTYFQYITRNSLQFARLYEEVEHARIYANFQAHRFRNRISMIFEDLPECLHDRIVPKVILQPVIENAFEHGLKNKIKDGLLKISFEYADDYFDIIIEDNGDEMTDEDIHHLQSLLDNDDDNLECTGLINIHRRIVLSCGKGSGVSVSRGELGGFKAVLHIEAIRQEDKGQNQVETIGQDDSGENQEDN